MTLNDRNLTRNDFLEQLLRMIVALRMSMRSVENVKLQKAFICLISNLRFFSSSTIKNQLIRRRDEFFFCYSQNFLKTTR
jgi:hypothetical protein